MKALLAVCAACCVVLVMGLVIAPVIRAHDEREKASIECIEWATDHPALAYSC